MKEFKPRDKLTQRMTRDGAVLDNQTTGAEIHISERAAEKQQFLGQGGFTRIRVADDGECAPTRDFLL